MRNQSINISFKITNPSSILLPNNDNTFTQLMFNVSVYPFSKNAIQEKRDAAYFYNFINIIRLHRNYYSQYKCLSTSHFEQQRHLMSRSIAPLLRRSSFRKASRVGRSICVFSHKNSIRHAIVKRPRASNREPNAILKLITRIGLLRLMHLQGVAHRRSAA